MFLAEYDYNEDIAVKKEEAYEDGFSDGFDDGFNDGFNDGFGDGAAQTKMENARALINTLHLSLADVVKCLNLSIQQQEILEKELSLK